MDYKEKATIIIPSWNEHENLKECVGKIRKYYGNIHIIVINNGSTDSTQQWLETQKVDNIYFDEGVQTVGRALNVVLDNFQVNNYFFVIWPYVQVGAKTIIEMIKTLQENERSGVVGCCANDKPYEQNINIKSYEELRQLEKSSNDRNDYRVVGSDGLCYGFTRKLIDNVGRFDENLAYTDVMVDYQLRAGKSDYINMISRNAYVYENEASRNNIEWLQLLCQSDRHYLRKKWNTNYFMLSSNNKFNLLIDKKEYDEFTVLEVGCDMGANLLGIKNAHPNCKIYGYEINRNSVEIGEHIAEIVYGNIEDEAVHFDTKFDYIIFGDVLEHLHNPMKTIEYCKTLLNREGRIIASIPNIMHISVMEQLLKGEFRYTDVGLLDKTHIHLFTQKEIVRMFTEAGYEIEILQGIIFAINQEQEELISKLMCISEEITDDMYKVYQYSVVARML
nr:methyltransferase domain-containing protein [uncultured Agathobacter sp.]